MPIGAFANLLYFVIGIAFIDMYFPFWELTVKFSQFIDFLRIFFDQGNMVEWWLCFECKAGRSFEELRLFGCDFGIGK